MVTQRRREGADGFSLKDYDDIYLDTCALLAKDFRDWLRQWLPELLRTGKKLKIPYPVAQELAYLAQGITSNCCREAGQAKDLVRNLVENRLAELSGDRSVSQQADLYLVKTASSDRFQRRIAVITQDKQLTEDLRLLNRIGVANPIHTYKLSQGKLIPTGKNCRIGAEKEQRTPVPCADNASEICKLLRL